MGDETETAKPAKPEWPITIVLQRPIEFGGETVTELVFQRGKLGYLKGMSLERTPVADEAMLIASRLCGKPIRVIEELEGDDAKAVLVVTLAFFARCLGTGATT